MIIDPSLQNPNDPRFEDILDAHKRETAKYVNCMRVGIIQSFDAADQTVTVNIAQQRVAATAPDGTQTIVPYPPLLKVPVQFPSGGGFTLTFPISPGDECLVLFHDREFDNWFTSGQVVPPTSARVHDLSDGFALVGVRNATRSLGSVSTTTTQLRSDDGTTFVEIAGGGIVNVAAPTEINLNTPIVNIAGVININNENSVTDSCVINGTIIATGDVQSLSGAHKLSTHVHSGVMTGSGDTGGPVG